MTAAPPLPTATAIAAAIRRGELRARAATEDCLQRIAAGDGGLHSFVEVFGDRARQRADAVDAARARGEHLGPLAGVPVALKDNLLLEGQTAA